MTVILKSCPWCGHIPTIQPWPIGPPGQYRVLCENGLCPAIPEVVAETKRKAINAWNRRTRSD